jgi:uncharacterized membrane protein HdeD (DUF308 family)
MYLIMQNPDGSLTFRKFATHTTVVFLGKLTIAAGVCTIAAGIWRSSTGKCWLLVLNGLALSALGLILNGSSGTRVSFRTVANLLVVVAMSIGIFELATARTLRRHVPHKWFLGLVGAASLGFALAFLWIKPESGSHSDFLWIGSYFGFSAISMLVLALLLQRLPRTAH